MGHKRNSESLIPLKQFRRSVIVEQFAIADVSREHRIGRVTCLLSKSKRKIVAECIHGV